jgi:hypothetical protein
LTLRGQLSHAGLKVRAAPLHMQSFLTLLDGVRDGGWCGGRTIAVRGRMEACAKKRRWVADFPANRPRDVGVGRTEGERGRGGMKNEVRENVRGGEGQAQLGRGGRTGDGDTTVLIPTARTPRSARSPYPTPHHSARALCPTYLLRIASCLLVCSLGVSELPGDIHRTGGFR